jgi:TonB family protein
MLFVSRTFGVAIATCWFALLVFAAGPYSRAARLIQKEKQTAEQHLQNAREALHEKKFGKATDEAKRASSIDKDLPEPYLLLAIACRQRGELTDAVRYVKRALEHDPKYADAHYILGLLLFQQKNFVAAQEQASLSIVEGPKFPNAYVLIAQADLAIGKLEEAVDAFEKALQLTRSNKEEAQRLTDQIGALKGWIDSRSSRRDPSYIRPKLLNTPQPRYTDEARTAKIEGIVRLAVRVSEEGSVTSTLVFVGIGFGLDQEAIRAAQALKFKPATKDGKPVPFWQLVVVEFNLRSRVFGV